MTPERGLWQHTSDGFLQHLFRASGQELLRRDLPNPARIFRMPIIDFVLQLFTGESHLPGVNHNDKVATVQVGREGWVVFPPQYPGDGAGETSNRFPLRIHKIPTAGSQQDLAWGCRRLSFHTAPRLLV